MPWSGRTELAGIARSAVAANSRPLATMLALTRWCSGVPLSYPTPERCTASGYYGDFNGFRFGGSEEAVIHKGSPWPPELARVLCALLQVAGIPSRLVFLYREEPPMLHVVAEAWVDSGWAVCDPCANRCYIWPHHGYASARDLQQQPRLVMQVPEHGRHPYVSAELYRTIGIAPYTLTAEPAPDSDMAATSPAYRERLQAAARVFRDRQ
jgi:hypothetical protein